MEKIYTLKEIVELGHLEMFVKYLQMYCEYNVIKKEQ